MVWSMSNTKPPVVETSRRIYKRIETTTRLYGSPASYHGSLVSAILYSSIRQLYPLIMPFDLDNYRPRCAITRYEQKNAGLGSSIQFFVSKLFSSRFFFCYVVAISKSSEKYRGIHVIFLLFRTVSILTT